MDNKTEKNKRTNNFLSSLVEKSKKLFSFSKLKILITIFLGACIILIFLSSLGNSSKTKADSSNDDSMVDSYAKRVESRLEEILSFIDGVDNVKALVYVSSSEEVVYMQDVETVISGDNKTIKETTVFDKSGGQSTAVVVVTKYPKIEGILIVANGVGNSVMKLKIIDSVACIFGLSPTQIEVLEGE